MKITIVGLLLLPLAAWAADEIKPFDVKLGLWESTVTAEMTGMPAMPQIPEATLNKMSPEQRARVEAMMKSRGGAVRPATTSKSCVTKETLAHAFAPPDKSCTMKVLSSSGTTQVAHVECKPNETRMTGDVTLERIDSGHVKGNGTVKAETNPPISSKLTFEAKWLSSDCGDVKPVTDK